MKALKEKRLSLRSYLRRGLVILSLLALAFASASCSDSTGDDGDNKDTPPPVPTKKAKDIKIVTGPKNLWFQGVAPDPTGMVVKVEWDDGSPAQEFPADKWAANGLSISPPVCDEPGAQVSIGYDFVVQHVSNPGRPSEPINYGGVVWLYSADDIIGGDLYADKGLDGSIEGKTTTLHYVYKSGSPYANPSGVIMDPTVVREERTLTINRVYPKPTLYDFTNMPSTKTYKVMIGKEKAGGVNPVGITVKVGTFYQVVNVKLGDTSGAKNFWVYDDDDTVTKGVSSTDPKLISDALSDKLKGVKFEVWYQASNDSNQQPKIEVITWEQFLQYVKDAHNTLNTIDTTWTARGIVKGGLDNTRLALEETGFYESYDKTILNYTDDSTWPVLLEYVPKEYLDDIAGVYGPGAMSGWVGTVEVALPVAVFANDIKVEQKFGYGLDMVEFKTAPAQMSDIVLKEINDRWKLSATYTLNNQSTTRPMGFTTAMFNWGNNGAGRGSNVVLNDNGNLSKMATASVQSGLWFQVNDPDDLSRNFPLPVRYRGETATEDDTVRVQLFKVGTK